MCEDFILSLIMFGLRFTIFIRALFCLVCKHVLLSSVQHDTVLSDPAA